MITRLHELSATRRWYKLFDDKENQKKKSEGALVIEPKNANKQNELGYGIFWENNLFDGSREAKNIKQVVAWAVDIDTGSKEEQAEKIKKFLLPSVIIESKNGYHCYWYTDDQEPNKDTYKTFIEDYFLDNLSGDPKAKDVSRIFRVPNTFHMKNMNAPYMVNTVLDTNAKFDQRTIKKYFPVSNARKQKAQKREEMRQIVGSIGGGDLFANVYDMDQMAALQRLSGTEFVNGEQFAFRQNANGNKNIFVNGKSTSCFIDREYKIGSAEGGPTVWQWLKYYGHSDKTIFQIVKQIFPELVQK